MVRLLQIHRLGRQVHPRHIVCKARGPRRRPTQATRWRPHARGRATRRSDTASPPYGGGVGVVDPVKEGRRLKIVRRGHVRDLVPEPHDLEQVIDLGEQGIIPAHAVRALGQFDHLQHPNELSERSVTRHNPKELPNAPQRPSSRPLRPETCPPSSTQNSGAPDAPGRRTAVGRPAYGLPGRPEWGNEPPGARFARPDRLASALHHRRASHAWASSTPC